MKKIQTLSAVLLMAFLASPLISAAKFPGILQRLQVGYSFVSNSATYEGSTFVNFPGMRADTSFSFDMKTKAAFGGTIGTYFPLARLGRISTLCLSVDYLYSAMLWDSKVPTYTGNGFSEFTFSGGTVQMALPVGLDFKFGCDALGTKSRRFCTTLGFGVYPSYAMTSLDFNVDVDPNISVAPYAKFEVGIFAGICMKLRTIYSYGNFNYMEVNSSEKNELGDMSSSTTLTGKSNLTVSLLFMPFSWKWSRAEWWNTF